jgi:hypothetical protein
VVVEEDSGGVDGVQREELNMARGHGGVAAWRRRSAVYAPARIALVAALINDRERDLEATASTYAAQ